MQYLQKNVRSMTRWLIGLIDNQYCLPFRSTRVHPMVFCVIRVVQSSISVSCFVDREHQSSPHGLCCVIRVVQSSISVSCFVDREHQSSPHGLLCDSCCSVVNICVVFCGSGAPEFTSWSVM